LLQAVNFNLHLPKKRKQTKQNKTKQKTLMHTGEFFTEMFMYMWG